MRRAHQHTMPREAVLDLAQSGKSARALASQFGVTEWTVRRWLAHAERRKQLPYWKQMAGAPSAPESGDDRV